MKIPPCSFIRACLFIRILKLFHPACLLEPARLLGRQEYVSVTPKVSLKSNFSFEIVPIFAQEPFGVIKKMESVKYMKENT